MTETRDAEIHHLIAGELCLDFANTLYGHVEAIHEYLFDYRDLVLWSRHAGILSPQAVEILLLKGEQASVESEAVFQQAIRIRETIFHVFASLAHNESPQDDYLNLLHKAWLENEVHAILVQTQTGFTLGWERGEWESRSA